MQECGRLPGASNAARSSTPIKSLGGGGGASVCVITALPNPIKALQWSSMTISGRVDKGWLTDQYFDYGHGLFTRFDLTLRGSRATLGKRKEEKRREEEKKNERRDY